MERHDYISLLGLALRGGRLIIGAEAVGEAIRENAVRLLLLGGDASERTQKHAAYLAQSGHCLLLTLPDGKAALGQGLGRASASLMALTDAGLAAAVGQRLAAANPERYAEAAERLRLKSARAKERRARRDTQTAERLRLKPEQAKERRARRNAQTAERPRLKPEQTKEQRARRDAQAPKKPKSKSRPRGKRNDWHQTRSPGGGKQTG